MFKGFLFNSFKARIPKANISIWHTNKTVFKRSYATYKKFNQANNNFDFSKLLYNRNLMYFGLGCGGFYVYNLHEAPFTHRLRFIWIPYWLETKIGDFSYKQILRQYQSDIRPHSDPLYSRISNIMNKLLTAALDNSTDEGLKSHLKKLKWSIHVINVDPSKVPPNAFILPNGKIFIFSSILPVCHDDDGLATVLSHELSHQLAHHSSEQLSKQPFYIVLLATLYAATGISWFNDLLIEGLLRMPASREMELEADHIGCELMARLCFNVPSAIHFWERMNSVEQKISGKGRTPLLQEFFSTHPNTNKRIHDIQSWMSDLQTIKESSGCHEYQFDMFNQVQRNFFR